MSKLVTIGLPIYKRLEYLPHVLEIVAAQDYPNIELLVSDNGMNGTRVREIVDAHYSRPYRFRQNPATIPSSQHFNQVVQEAAGEFFMILCDDDEISPNYVSELVHSLESSPESSVAIARQEMLSKDGKVIRASADTMPGVMSGPDFIEATWHHFAFGMEMVGTYLVRTDKLKACGGYPDFCRGAGIDNALLLKLILNCSVALNTKGVFRWRLDDASYGWSLSTAELALATRQFLDFLNHDPIVNEYASACPAQWKVSKGYLVTMSWKTYFGRWESIYRERLSWLSWVKSAFALPFIPDYYRLVFRHLYSDMRGLCKKRIFRIAGKNPSCAN